MWSSEIPHRLRSSEKEGKLVGDSEKRGGVGSVRRSPHARVDHLHTALEPIIKVSLAATTSEDLRLDHELGLGCGATRRISAILFQLRFRSRSRSLWKCCVVLTEALGDLLGLGSGEGRDGLGGGDAVLRRKSVRHGNKGQITDSRWIEQR